jgi:flagellar basal-body rod protein FlgB
MRTYRPIRLAQEPLAGLDRLSRHLAFHTHRQQVIAANLANIDTPGYRSRELVFEENLEVARRGGESAVTLGHAEEAIVADDEPADLDGNTVALEAEMAKMTANGLRYRGLAELLSRKLGMLKYAAVDGRG